MHAPHAGSALTPFQVVGQLSRLRLGGEKPNDIALTDPQGWTPDEFAERHGVISDLVDRIEVIGRPEDHTWHGVGLSSILPTDVERLTGRIASLAERLAGHDEAVAGLAAQLEQLRPAALKDLAPLAALASRIAEAPQLAAVAMAAPAWDERAGEIATLLALGGDHAALQLELAASVAEDAWTSDLEETIAALALLPPGFDINAFASVTAFADGLPRLMSESASLARTMGRDAPTTMRDAARLAQVGERVAAAPDASAEAFAADLWDGGVERAADVAEAVARLEAARARIGDGLSDAAWGMDLAAARTVLAMHGTGFFKIFSGEWRRSNRLVRSVLSRPDAPLDDVLGMLDALAAGQAAKRSIDADEALGRSAFASHWRGDRSTSAPLLALVDWMRSRTVCASAARAEGRRRALAPANPA